MAVVEQNQVAQTVAVEIAGEQVAGAWLELDRFHRLEAVIRTEVDFVPRLRTSGFNGLGARPFIRSGVAGQSEQHPHREERPDYSHWDAKVLHNPCSVF